MIRDLKLSVIFRDVSGLAVIGEIQLHDAALYNLKKRVPCYLLLIFSLPAWMNWPQSSLIMLCVLQMHKLYRVKRASSNIDSL